MRFVRIRRMDARSGHCCHESKVKYCKLKQRKAVECRCTSVHRIINHCCIVCCRTCRCFQHANFMPIVCVCVFSSHSFWTPSSLDVPAGVTQEEGHTGFPIHLLSAVRALIFFARRIQPFLSLVDREVEFCVLTI